MIYVHISYTHWHIFRSFFAKFDKYIIEVFYLNASNIFHVTGFERHLGIISSVVGRLNSRQLKDIAV